ncbi:MAG: DUF6171 family protein [Lachnospiraceae bacterium]|nr:DUF6171 family protein [Lachnospiraceae bacterium]
MESTNTGCKLCLLRENNSKKKEYELIQRALAAMNAQDKASSETYEKRLEACKSCESFVEGTCLKCGCYVELRAAGKVAHCPKKNGPW